MPLGLEAAGQVHRQAAVAVDTAVLDRTRALAPGREAHGFVGQQFRDGEAVVHFGEVDIIERHARLCQRHVEGALRAFEGGEVAAGHGQAIADMHRRTKAGRLRETRRIVLGGQHQGRGAVGDQRAVGQA